MLSRIALLSGALLLHQARCARADADEWRLAASASAWAISLHTAAADSSGLGFGGRARLAYGATNSLELHLEASAAHTRALEFSGATLQRQHGTLFADLTTAEITFGLRWELGVEIWRALERVHPFVGIRGGGLLTRLSSQELLNSQDMLLLEPGSELTVRPLVGATAGVERRFGDHLFVGLSLDVAFAAGYRHLGTHLEISWGWY